MRRRRPSHARTALAGSFALLLWFAFVVALTASNSIPSTRAGRTTKTIDANVLKPTECAALNLTTVVRGSTGTSGADLLLGTTGIDTMMGNAGDDCILGGGGNDVIDGGAGTDVCIGGPGLDTFLNCETQIQ